MFQIAAKVAQRLISANRSWQKFYSSCHAVLSLEMWKRDKDFED